MKMMRSSSVPCMKKSFVGVLFTFLIGLLILRYRFTDKSTKILSPFSLLTDHHSDILHVEEDIIPESLESMNQENKSQADVPFIINNTTIKGLFSKKNLTIAESKVIIIWNDMRKVLYRPDLLPEVVGGLQEAVIAWEDLLASIEEEKAYKMDKNDTVKNITKEKQCPFALSPTNMTYNQADAFVMPIPCGFIQDSSITIVGIPDGLLGNFKIEFLGAKLPGETDAPIILHYNVRLKGDKLTENPVIVQNTWTLKHDWGDEQRCPHSEQGPKVDNLSRCSEQVGAAIRTKHPDRKVSGRTKWTSLIRKGSKEDFWFPFVENYPFAATLWAGLEGFHMTVNGKHISSFEYRESLEPWLVSGVRIAGDIKLLSVLANGLPSSENLDLVADLESLKAPPLARRKKLTLFIGVFSTGNNFERRMAVRRSWMQYNTVKTGEVAVRFFVGMHKNKQVNEELWKEAETYGDVQLMPFVDYYNLITLKTIAICIYGTKFLNAKYIMKTDDDAFVRVDAVLQVLNKTKVTRGLLYGKVAFESQPHRDQESKWYISPEEWQQDFYPPWAHGPGYIVSKDIAKFVVRGHQEKKLKLFKLEDVAMGIWIEEFKKRGQTIQYINDERFHNTGCDTDYVVAHYQGPRHMLCLWKKLNESSEPTCCE